LDISFDVVVGALAYAVPALVILSLVRRLDHRRLRRDEELVSRVDAN
jgi:hypothetical protein